MTKSEDKLIEKKPMIDIRFILDSDSVWKKQN